MNLEASSGRRSISPTSSGRSSPVPRTSRRAVEDELYRGDKTFRRYGALIQRALASWETAPQEWADYIAFLGRLLKAIQSHPKDVPLLPHTDAVASKLAQCLNPALPSGVHQKTLEVYAYIFDTFDQQYLAAHLHDYLPGLSPVLSFASLSVRPGVYSIFENHIIKFNNASLRPALRSLILSLLPAIEDETSEDFDRAFAILEALERKFCSESAESQRSGYFWQCLFLCVVTSPSRRQGALAYIIRNFPSFAPRRTALTVAQSSDGEDDGEVSEEARAITVPEPGLLVRCFVAGLSDAQALVQRGFLDVLVTRLPLNSPVLQRSVEETDLDRLVVAALRILLRRDMSLNKRLWSWFLGPERKDGGRTDTPSSPTLERASSGQANHQLRYFETFARAPLQRCILQMLSASDDAPITRALPFRVCLSLMDRWEIGGLLVPELFLPAIESVYLYSSTVPASMVAEVLKSASLFFDGVEASLIWSKLSDISQLAFSSAVTDKGRLHLLDFVLSRFNVRDEEMVTVHAPLLFLQLSSSLLGPGREEDTDSVLIALDILGRLLSLLPSKVLESGPEYMTAQDVQSRQPQELQNTIRAFYGSDAQSVKKLPSDIVGSSIGELIQSQISTLVNRMMLQGSSKQFNTATQLLLDLQTKVPSLRSTSVHDCLNAVSERLCCSGQVDSALDLPTLSTTSALVTALCTTDIEASRRAKQLLPHMLQQLWTHLSPSKPKYHVETVRLIWQVETLPSDNGLVQASLLSMMQNLSYGNGAEGRQGVDREAASRFSVLWDHTILAGPSNTASTGVRRASTLPTVADTAQTATRLRILTQPLLRVIDTLREPQSAAGEWVVRWLASLPSLQHVLEVLLQRAVTVLEPVGHQGSTAEDHERSRRDDQRDLAHSLAQVVDVLRSGNSWTWECMTVAEVDLSEEQSISAPYALGRMCLRVLATTQNSSLQSSQQAVALLDMLLTSSAIAPLQDLDILEAVLKRLTASLEQDDDPLQGPLLKLALAAITVEVGDTPVKVAEEDARRPSTSARRQSESASKAKMNGTDIPSTRAPTPPAQLLQCLRLAFASRSARSRMTQWIAFLGSILPIYGTAIFASLIPLVDTLCLELNAAFDQLLSMTASGSDDMSFASDSAIVNLLEALEMTLAQAHECLVIDSTTDEQGKAPGQANTFLGTVASGVFRVEGPPSKTAQANSRLTVILAFHDASRVCLRVWNWSNHFADVRDYDKGSAATTAHYALRLRNKCRYLLEQMFAVEPLESLETLIARWRSAKGPEEASAAISLLSVMRGSRPRHVLPAILDALCSRTNPSALPPARLSSQTVDLSAPDVVLFLIAYLEATEDDAMDEIWPDCVAFLRDVLANPLPFRQIIPALLSFTHLLAKKLGNTNFGEQKKMRRDLGDVFQRLLAAAFTTMPSSFVTDPADALTLANGDTDVSFSRRGNVTLPVVLTQVVPELDMILESNERITGLVNSISTSLLAPLFHAKSFPSNVSSHHLRLLLALAKKAPTSKAWRKDTAEAFNDPRLFLSPFSLMRDQWLPVLYQWSLRDKERMTELLSRLTPPSAAGMMFGVGATAARLEADRKAQLNLRRISLLLLAAPEDTWSSHLRDFDEKLVELFSATHSSSPSYAIKAELFMLVRALVLSLGPTNLSPLWPVLNGNLQLALTSLMSAAQDHRAYTNLGLLQACKLLDELTTLAPEEFQLHEWLYIADTVDAVYQPPDWQSTALADQVAESLGTSALEDSRVSMASDSAVNDDSRGRRPLFALESDNSEDVKAMAKEDFAKAVVRPFLSQLSIHAYEGVYGMEPPDIEACRWRLLEDLLDIRTIVE